MDDAEVEVRKISRAQWTLIGLIVALATGSVLYRLLMDHNLGHSAAMFIGIPAVIAILLALTPKTKSITGGILKGITLALLIVAPLVGEGYLCILMAAPLFYVVGVIVGIVADTLRERRGAKLSCVVLILLPMSMEGVLPVLSFNRDEVVEARRVVEAPADLVEQRMALSPDLNRRLPWALRIGFPRPLKASGAGLAIGAVRTIHFAGAEGDPPGDLMMRVTDRSAGYVRFEAVSDGSKLTQWIAWSSSEVEWRTVDQLHTLVTWKVHFKRQLDPAWYFAPLERVAVEQAAQFLIEANATPPGAGAVR
ncbi:MAG: hypothetical protein ABSF28_12825 [Terracidiphilus sp.]